MNMQDHILAAMRECYDDWRSLLDGLEAGQIGTALDEMGWTIKDVLAHLWVWQQLTNARVSAAAQGGEPLLPEWVAQFGVAAEDAPADKVNALMHQMYRQRAYRKVRGEWQAGFERLLETAAQISEPDFIGWGRYPWLGEAPLAAVLIASYDHHIEHLHAARAALH